jgi:HAD superfamily hydrolase (TIGR01549 family)
MLRLHRHIGMGGDQYVAAVAGDEVERRLGDELRDASHEEFLPLRDECEPLDGAHELLVELKRRGFVVVLASSASEEDLGFFLDRLEAREVVDGWTSADDVDRSKPHPDVVHAALERAGTDEGVFLGDSRWDVEAAANAGLGTVCVITGGWARQELEEAGAAGVYESLVELRDRLDETPFADAADTMRPARWR